MRRLVCFLVACVAALCCVPYAAWGASSSGLLINGAGYGHGIGMSQYGALGFAEHGYGYADILAHYYTGTTLAQAAPSTVSVLVSKGSAAVSGATRANNTKLSAGRTYAIQADGSELKLTTGGRRVGVFHAPLHIRGAALKLAGHGRYRGRLTFRPSGSEVLGVNVVGLDDYVRGVVARESPSSWPLSALEAQAVAARTYVLASQAVNPFYDVYSDTRSQVYGGESAETANSNAAVAATSGQVVEYQGRPVTTYFSASSGGETESIQNVWLGATPEEWLTGVSDPFDDAGSNPYHHWSRHLSL
ncbi:MAG: SpoIID/LytB domain-containing protein, partial [Solirubrobacterales bacterium]|nr:SpoIID/LytB domain-containing protein [Solirubrobacterales bacterium]